MLHHVIPSYTKTKIACLRCAKRRCCPGPACRGCIVGIALKPHDTQLFGRPQQSHIAQVVGQGGLPGLDLRAAPLDGKGKLALQAAVALMAVGGGVFGAPLP